MFGEIDPHPNGLPRKRFNECIDHYLTHGTLNPDILWFCNKRQQDILNEIKKSLIRLKKKQ